MKTLQRLSLVASLLFTVLAGENTRGATLILSDSYSVTGSGSGFALNAGVNTGINPPTTRLTGSTIANLRYYQTYTNRPTSAYDINSNRLRVTTGNSIGRFTLSANGAAPFDFGPAVGATYATAANRVIYDVKVGMRNDATGNPRFSLGLATVEGDINNMDFAIQMYRANTGDTFYTLQKRIDRGSFNGTTTTDGTGDLNAVMITTAAGTVTTMIDFLIRVTDAGAESGTSYNSRVQVSTNNGTSWIYDTDSDTALPNGFRFDGGARYFAFDQAPNTTGNVFYDSFSVTWNSGPRLWTGLGANGNWNNPTNWGGAVPVNGSSLTFNGTTRQTSTNDISGLSSPWLKFNNGGFSLWGNAFTLNNAATNTIGNNTVNAPLTLGGAVRIQSDADTLTVAGGITGGVNNLTVDGAGNTTVNSSISGTGSLTKNGAGTLTLSGAVANTLSGNTLVNAGTLALAKTAGVNAIAGNITIGDGTGTDVLQLSAADQISDSSVVTISAGGSLNLNGFAETLPSISSSSASSQIALGTGTLTVGNGSAITFSGSISGTGSIVKQGTSSLTLNGASSFSGTATVNTGVLNVQNATALGGAGATIVSGGAALEVQGGFTFSESLTLNGTGIGSSGALRNISGNNSWSGNVTLASASRVNSDSGTLTISGSVSGGQALTAGGVGNTTISGVLSGAGSLTKDGSGTLILSGADTYTGSTTISAGTLALGAGGSIGNSPSITIVNGATLNVSAVSFTLGTSQTLVRTATSGAGNVTGNLTFGSGSQASFQADGAGTVGSISVTGNLTANGNTLTININGSPLGAGIYPLITYTGSKTGSFNSTPIITGAGVASGYLTEIQESAGQINLRIYSTTRIWSGGGANDNWSTAANWDGVAPVAGDKLTFSGATRLANINDISGLSVPSLNFTSGGFSISGNGLTVTTAITNSTGNNTISAGLTLGGVVKLQSDAGTLTVGAITAGANNLTVEGAGNTTASGAISGSGSVTKNGAGTLQFSGASANTYSGGTVINAGTLTLAKTAGINAIPGNVTIGDGTGTDTVRLTAANQIADSATVTISSGGVLDLNGFAETVATVSGASTSSQVALGAGTLTVDSSAASTFAGVISGTGQFVKKGSGNMTLSGANTYSGDTTINSGKITVAAGGSIASSSGYIVNSGATLDVSAITFTVGSGKSLESKASSGKGDVVGNITLASGATFLAQANGGASIASKLDITGNITLNGNTLTVNVTGGALNVGTYALITFTGSRTGTFNTAPTITGSGLVSGLAARITHTSGLISLHVYNPSWTDTIFKTMHYNVHFATHNGVTDTTTTSQYITNNNVDIVGMNEVDRFRDRSGNRDLPAEYENKTGYNVVFTNAAQLSGNDETGNAVLSRFPILYRERIFLPQDPAHERRCLLKTVVDVKGKFVNFWSTHLDFHADNTERLMAVTNFNTWVQEEVFPTIICGDFNDTPDQPFYNRMEQQWEDAWLEGGDGSLGRTAPCPGFPNNLNARLDYIFRVKGSTLTATNMIVAYTLEESDHYGVVSRFQLNITTNRSSGFFFRFDEGSGTNVLDSVGGLKGNFPTSGAPTWSTDSPSGLPGDSSLFFNGTKKLTITDTKQVIGTNGANDSYTIQAWVKVAVNYAPAQRAVLFQYDRKPGFSISINTNRTLHTTAFKILDVPSTATLPNDGQWHHVAVVHTDGSNMKYYIDGVLSATVTYTGGAGYRTSADITVGADSTGINPFTGYLARVKFDNRALSASQLDTVATPPQGRLVGPSEGNDLESWKSLHSITDVTADADNDGQNNFAEFVAGTNPNDADSAFRLVDAKVVDGRSVLTWSSVGGVRYRLQYTEELSQPFKDIVRDAEEETDPRASGTGGTQSYTDKESSPDKVRYYRIRIIR